MNKHIWTDGKDQVLKLILKSHIRYDFIPNLNVSKCHLSDVTIILCIYHNVSQTPEDGNSINPMKLDDQFLQICE